jgi:hypothetical protein
MRDVRVVRPAGDAVRPERRNGGIAALCRALEIAR